MSVEPTGPVERAPIEERPDTAVRCCLGCGYNLTGLAPVGNCPECGAYFDPGSWHVFTPRPPFGYLVLAIPPLLAPAGA